VNLLYIALSLGRYCTVLYYYCTVAAVEMKASRPRKLSEEKQEAAGETLQTPCHHRSATTRHTTTHRTDCCYHGGGGGGGRVPLPPGGGGGGGSHGARETREAREAAGQPPAAVNR